MLLSEFVDRLAQGTMPDKAASWDAVGLQIGDPASPVETVAVTHELTEEVTTRLEEEPVDLVVSYHPLIFQPVRRLVPGRSPEGRATRLLLAGVSVVVTHTDFDAMRGGTADALAEVIGLENISPFGPMETAGTIKVVTFVPENDVDPLVDSLSAAGAGRIGNYHGCSYRTDGFGSFFAGAGTRPTVGATGMTNLEPEIRVEMIAPRSKQDAVVAALVAAHPYEEPAFDVYDVRSNHGFVGRVGDFSGDWDALVDQVETGLRPQGVRLASLGTKVSRVAVVPGSGSSLIGAAVATGADVLLTGDMSHHNMVAATDRGLAVIDAGHAATEKPGMGRLRSLVAEIAPRHVYLER